MNSKYAKLLIALVIALLLCLPASGMAATTDETIQVNPRYAYPVKDSVMYVTEGETVTITGNPSCSDPDATFVHFWLVGTYDENGNFVEDGPPSRESTYSFVATADMNGKVIDYSAGIGSVVLVSKHRQNV